jgi:molybdopterin synthase catalytic subunit
MDGSGQTFRTRVSADAIDPSALVAEVSRPDAGATTLFLGTVRDHSGDKKGVTHLDYEVYEERVVPEIDKIVGEAAGKWPVLAVVVEHRIGEVRLEEASVAVAVSSAHRADAFDAARYVIDELKVRAPIWKKEFWPGGEEWSQGS